MYSQFSRNGAFTYSFLQNWSLLSKPLTYITSYTQFPFNCRFKSNEVCKKVCARAWYSLFSFVLCCSCLATIRIIIRLNKAHHVMSHCECPSPFRFHHFIAEHLDNNCRHLVRTIFTSGSRQEVHGRTPRSSCLH